MDTQKIIDLRRVFISRSLGADSIFRKALEERQFELQDLSLIHFVPEPFKSLPEVDWIFFYSRNAVSFFFQQLDWNGQTLSQGVQLAAMGPGTARELQRGGRPVAFVGDGRAETTAEAFLERAAGQRVLFPRAKISRRSVQSLIADRIQEKDLVVYRNEPVEEFVIPYTDYLVFTSPLNAKTYYARYEPADEQRIIAIGATTEAALEKLGVTNVRTAGSPSEAALVELIMAWEEE